LTAANKCTDASLQPTAAVIQRILYPAGTENPESKLYLSLCPNARHPLARLLLLNTFQRLSDFGGRIALQSGLAASVLRQCGPGGAVYRKPYFLALLEEVNALQTQNKERWRELCEQIAMERNPEKFLAAIEELNSVLDAREKGRHPLSHQMYRVSFSGNRDPTIF
jgi:hypothetical protein